ncbi:hypothetical protein ET989_02275 [Propioniciclava sinopodophylli]|uniref:Uncharacterized protein n=1 Tax=Propioniciclava sinopodophylli TaxID=1837344 RepID=A0A4Q9KGD3_9ACTN|nr:hypothetical protein [Propioniciclava sinopodophylli]TBT87161.1 hypothetical protein ET989_02275 [Propioniciclava sinopodophylli]
MGKKLTGLVVAMILAGSAGMGAVMGMMGGPEKQRSVRPSIVVGGGAVTNGSADADAPQEQADAPGAEGYLLPADGSWSAALDQAAAERAEAERLAAEAAAAAAQRSAQQVKAGPKKAAPKPVYRADDDDDDDDEWDDDDDDEYDD